MLKLFTDRKYTMKLHLALMVMWIILIVPTLLWWKESILWVLMISIYANIVGHWGAFQAVKSEPEDNG